MDELLKYVRLVFEVRYLNSASDYKCIIDMVKMGVYRCICMPGVAANYILKVLKNCFVDFDGYGDIIWDSDYHRFVAICRNKGGKEWFCNFFDKAVDCIYEEDVCVIRKIEGLTEEQNVEFAYIKNRSKADIKRAYGITKEPYRIEKCLALLPEKDNNSKNYVHLFSYVANEYKTVWDMIEYLDKLFRLYFFLFPEECLDIVKRYSLNTTDEDFFAYNKQLLTAYYELATIGNGNLGDNDFKTLTKFLGFDIEKVDMYYKESNMCGDIQAFREVVIQKINSAKALNESIKDILDNYLIYH